MSVWAKRKMRSFEFFPSLHFFPFSGGKWIVNSQTTGRERRASICQPPTTATNSNPPSPPFLPSVRPTKRRRVSLKRNLNVPGLPTLLEPHPLLAGTLFLYLFLQMKVYRHVFSPGLIPSRLPGVGGPYASLTNAAAADESRASLGSNSGPGEIVEEPWKYSCALPSSISQAGLKDVLRKEP